MTGVLIKEGHLDTETDIHRSRTPSNMEAEMGACFYKPRSDKGGQQATRS